jgi:hypothetical protein
MSRTLKSETERNLNRLQRTIFCTIEDCDTYKAYCTDRTEIGNGQWLCSDCEDTPTGKLLQGDRR